MNHVSDKQDEDRTDLGAASIETRGQHQGLIADNFDTKVSGGMSDD